MHPTPVSLAVSGYVMLEAVSVCDADTMELIRKLLPDLIMVILPEKPVPDILTAGSDQVGIRYPDHEITIRLIDHFRNPGNIHKRQPARRATSAGVCEISSMYWTALTVSSMAAGLRMGSPQPLSILWTCRFFGRVQGTSGL